MLTAIPGNAATVEAKAAAALQTSTPAATVAAASTAGSRVTAPDTVAISAQGQQASKATQDVDHDGDSH